MFFLFFFESFFILKYSIFKRETTLEIRLRFFVLF